MPNISDTPFADNVTGSATGNTHSEYEQVDKANSLARLGSDMISQAMAMMPETPEKAVASMQITTALMWVDRAVSGSYNALRKEREEKEAAVKRRYASALANVGKDIAESVKPKP
jgi:hypothetical protein